MPSHALHIWPVRAWDWLQWRQIGSKVDNEMNDSDRPPVLAHQRFAADRKSFAGLNLAQRFQRIHDSNLWGAAKSISGLGSELDATAVLRGELPRLLARLGVTSLLDAPCGDAGWISRRVWGCVMSASTSYPIWSSGCGPGPPRETSAATIILPILRTISCPDATPILCRDCLVHLSFANIERAVANFRRSGATWLIVTTFPGWQANLDCEDGDWRALNFEHAPFDWGAPVELLNEKCTEAGGGWRDKSLGVWRLSDL